MAPTKTSGDILDFGEFGFLSGASTQDPIGNGYIDFMRRTRWKIYQDSNRMKPVGNYLEVF